MASASQIIEPFDNAVTVAVDYNGTITNAHGEIKKKAVFWVKKLQKHGCKVVLWSCNEHPAMPSNLRLQMPDTTRGNTQKVNADIYIDDRNPLGCQWLAAYIKAIKLSYNRRFTA